MIRLVQIRSGDERRVALVHGGRLGLLESQVASVYDLVTLAEGQGTAIEVLAESQLSSVSLDYESVYRSEGPWRLLPPLDHPTEPARTLVSGTGLTHFGSARNRSAMHSHKPEELTDSMRMFHLGVENGRPAPGEIGAAPEWFYKGPGTILRAHGEPLDVPSHAEDGGEEAEVAGLYVVGHDGTPLRVGFANGNEFSDHRFERRNYLNLAGSKLRTCSLGPEIAVGLAFERLEGSASIERQGQTVWQKNVCTGEAEMCHSLANIEHHHFKFEAHRRPGDVHVHYFGAYALSFGDGFETQDGDVMTVGFAGLGRPLRNPLHREAPLRVPVRTRTLGSSR